MIIEASISFNSLEPRTNILLSLLAPFHFLGYVFSLHLKFLLLLGLRTSKGLAWGSLIHALIAQFEPQY